MYTNKAGDPDIVKVGIGCGVPKALPGRIQSTGKRLLTRVYKLYTLGTDRTRFILDAM